MARRKQSFFDDLIALASKPSWWLGVTLAVAAYAWLHGVATNGVAADSLPGKMNVLLGPDVFNSLVFLGQYGLPLVLLMGTAMSVYGRIRRDALNDPMTIGPGQGALGSMSWQQFEFMVSEAFRRRGYSVAKKEQGGAGGIFDLVLKKNGETFLVHCKQWRAVKVGVNTMHELYKMMADTGATGGFAVTSGVFTDEARALAKAGNIELMDGKMLHGLVRKVRVPDKVFLRDPLSILTTGAPFCPECQGRMTRRRSRRGASEEKEFWRCLRHPDCSGKRDI